MQKLPFVLGVNSKFLNCQVLHGRALPDSLTSSLDSSSHHFAPVLLALLHLLKHTKLIRHSGSGTYCSVCLNFSQVFFDGELLLTIPLVLFVMMLSPTPLLLLLTLSYFLHKLLVFFLIFILFCFVSYH